MLCMADLDITQRKPRINVKDSDTVCALIRANAGGRCLFGHCISQKNKGFQMIAAMS